MDTVSLLALSVGLAIGIVALVITRQIDRQKYQYQIEQLQKEFERKLSDKQKIYQFDIEQLKRENDREFRKRSLLIRLPKEQLQTLETKIMDEIPLIGKSTTSVKEFAQLSVDLLVGEFKLSHAAIFLVDSKKEFANMIAGTGEGGKIMVKRGHKWKLIDEQSAVGSCITRNAVCIDVFNLPFMGIFYSPVSSNPQDVSIPPFEFLEKGGFGCPDLPETRQRLVLPLRTETAVIGALDIHTNALDMGRESAELLLPLANLIAGISVHFDIS